MKNLLLAVDIGNTHTVLGLYDGKDLYMHWRISSKKNRTSDEYGIIFKDLFHLNNIPMEAISNIIISCVVPPLMPVLRDMSERYFRIKPLIVNETIKTSINNLYENKKDVGPDRIVNAVAAYKKYPKSIIIVDFGTAITLDIVTKNGEYLGGCIYPGILTAISALYERTSMLPKVEITRTASVIGKNTADSIRAGVVYGTASLVDGLIVKIKAELKENCKVIATGGFADLIYNESLEIEEVHPFLTLEGLKIIFDINDKSCH